MEQDLSILNSELISDNLIQKEFKYKEVTGYDLITNIEKSIDSKANPNFDNQLQNWWEKKKLKILLMKMI